ncbi:MAG: TolC family protein [Candidatus Omnitrophota bacterium]
MRCIFAAGLLIPVFWVSSARAEKDVYSLKECYEMALERSESIGIRKEAVAETEALMFQALGTALPTITYAYSQKLQDTAGQRALPGAVPEGKFTFSQPLFTGFKEFAAVAASRHTGESRRQALKRARELLFRDVSDAFYYYLSYQEDLDVLAATRDILLERCAELQKRQLIGRSRPGEAVSAEAKLRRTEALMEGVLAAKDIAGQLMEFLTGCPVGRLVDEEMPAVSNDLSAFYLKVDGRADVIAARENFEAYRNNVTMARAEFMPAVTLSGNSYTKRSAAYEGNHWDVTLGVTVPLFKGMSDWGRLRQAQSQARAADLDLSQSRRRAVLEIRQAVIQLQSSQKRVSALQKAVAASEENYKFQADDFQRSLVSNLDVLQALEDLQSVRRDLVAARADARRAFGALQVATGGI